MKAKNVYVYLYHFISPTTGYGATATCISPRAARAERKVYRKWGYRIGPIVKVAVPLPEVKK